MVELLPDTKDWTWVIASRCLECGFNAAELKVDEVPDLLRTNAFSFADGLTHESARHRTRPDLWSVLEYSCHVRDVHRIFHRRVTLMLFCSSVRVVLEGLCQTTLVGSSREGWRSP